MYAGGFHPYGSLEEHWAYWSRYVWVNRYVRAPGTAYEDLLELVRGRDYFVLTTNVDHQFQLAGFDRRPQDQWVHGPSLHFEEGEDVVEVAHPRVGGAAGDDGLDLLREQGLEVVRHDGDLAILEQARVAELDRPRRDCVVGREVEFHGDSGAVEKSLHRQPDPWVFVLVHDAVG